MDRDVDVAIVAIAGALHVDPINIDSHGGRCSARSSEQSAVAPNQRTTRPDMKDETSAAFCAASQFFVQAVSRVPKDGWTGVGLGEWTLLELAAHGNRAHTTVEDYLMHPQSPQPRTGPYFTAEAIAMRAREAVDALGDDPVAVISSTSARCCALVERSAPSAVVGSPAGTMTLAEYLPSRVAELVVHGMDVTRAIHTTVTPPQPALETALAFIASCAVKKSPEAVLLALTGREALPVDYNVF